MSLLSHGWSVLGPKGLVGPVSADAVRAAVEAGHVRRGDLVRHEHDADWQPVELSMFGASLPIDVAPRRPSLSWFQRMVHWALLGWMAYAVVDLLLYLRSPTITLWVAGTVGFLLLYVAGMRRSV